MTMRMYYSLGKFIHFVLRPLIIIAVNRTTRTRIIVRYNDEVLLMRNWLSSGEWSLPGGGLSGGEVATQGAARELQEETGVHLDAQQLRLLYDGKIVYGGGFNFRTIVFETTLTKKPNIQRQKKEISEIAWLSLDEVRNLPKTNIVFKKAGYFKK